MRHNYHQLDLKMQWGHVGFQAKRGICAILHCLEISSANGRVVISELYAIGSRIYMQIVDLKVDE